jgi:hypothetical protein
VFPPPLRAHFQAETASLSGTLSDLEFSTPNYLSCLDEAILASKHCQILCINRARRSAFAFVSRLPNQEALQALQSSLDLTAECPLSPFLLLTGQAKDTLQTPLHH